LWPRSKGKDSKTPAKKTITFVFASQKKKDSSDFVSWCRKCGQVRRQRVPSVGNDDGAEAFALKAKFSFALETSIIPALIAY
jgi:hypothetical protein